MSVTFAVRGDNLNARYSTAGKVPGLMTASAVVPKPVVISSADANSIGGFNIDQKTTAAARNLIYPGTTNWSNTNNFSVLIRARWGYTGNPPANTHAIFCAYGPTDITGGRFQLVHDAAGKFGAQLVNEYGTILVNFITGQAGDTTFSPVDGTYYDVLCTYDGSLTTAALKVYVGTTLFASMNASATYAASAENRNCRLVSGLGVGLTDAASRVDWELNECVVWDSVIDPTSVALVSGSGALGTSRASFVNVVAFDALDWTTLSADKIKSGQTQTQNGTVVTGTAVVNTAADVKHGVPAYDGTGSYRGADIWSALAADKIVSGNSQTQDGATVNGAAITNVAADVKHGVPSNTGVGSYRGADLWDLLAASKIKLGETQTQDGSIVTGTYAPVCDYPINGDVRDGTIFGSGLREGTLIVPNADVVELGEVFDNGTEGTLRVPDPTQVEDGVVFGPNDVLTGTFTSALGVTGKGEDGEDLLDDLETILKNELNAQITAIEAQKAAQNKSLTPGLDSIPTSAYYRQTWSQGILNNPFSLFFGIEDVGTVDGGGATALAFKIFIEVIMVDGGQTNDWDKRISRYTRAVKEVVEKNIRRLNYVSAIKVEAVKPQALQLDSSEEIKVGGVAITAAIY